MFNTSSTLIRRSTLIKLVFDIGYAATREFVCTAYDNLHNAGYYDLATELFNSWVVVKRVCELKDLA